MLEFAIKKWDKNKNKLREYFAKHKQKQYVGNYGDNHTIFTKKVIKIIFNDGDYSGSSWNNETQRKEFNINKFFRKIDFCKYAGTLIFVFAYDDYDPELYSTFYTSVDYGSCSGCDTLLEINRYKTDELPTEKQVDEYMQLALNLIQNMHSFKREDDE